MTQISFRFGWQKGRTNGSQDINLKNLRGGCAAGDLITAVEVVNNSCKDPWQGAKTYILVIKIKLRLYKKLLNFIHDTNSRTLYGK